MGIYFIDQNGGLIGTEDKEGNFAPFNIEEFLQEKEVQFSPCSHKGRLRDKHRVPRKDKKQIKLTGLL